MERHVDNYEAKLTDIDNQQKELLANVRQETELLELQRQQLIKELKAEQAKMKSIEQRLSDMKKYTTAQVPRTPNTDKSTNELLTEISDSEDDETGYTNIQGNAELDASLTRLALLDKTQREINQISSATESMLLQSKVF